jgi:outer membrane protein OmpA-like peptidoglycan-associated protein
VASPARWTLIFPENSVKYDQNLLTTAIKDYINRYTSVGYKVTSINLEGWASLGGKEERNQELSERRAKAVYDDLNKSLADSTVEMTSGGRGEDWNRLTLVHQSFRIERRRAAGRVEHRQRCRHQRREGS